MIIYRYLYKIVKKLPRNKLSFVALIVLFLVLIYLFYLKPSHELLFKQNSYFFLFDKIWSIDMDISGGYQAYRDFAFFNNYQNIKKQHDNAHAFGTTLYKKYGLEGIKYCGDSFDYGCYHSIVGSSILWSGTSNIDKIITQCKLISDPAVVSSCLHGMGHGILVTYGYELPDLKRALQICGKYKDKVDLVVCTSGIFMEYNFQNMHGYRSVLRPLNNQLYFPCNYVDAEFRPGCYFQEALWWLSVLPGDNSKKVKQIESLCDDLKNSEEIDQCYSGLFTHLGFQDGWDPIETKNLCSKLKTNDKEIACLMKSARVFARIAHLKKESLDICRALNDVNSSACIQQL